MHPKVPFNAESNNLTIVLKYHTKCTVTWLAKGSVTTENPYRDLSVTLHRWSLLSSQPSATTQTANLLTSPVTPSKLTPSQPVYPLVRDILMFKVQI